MDYGGDWINLDFNWDNIGVSLFNLFVIATCKIHNQNYIYINNSNNNGYFFNYYYLNLR